jgi:hypothetical protein
MDSQTNAVLGIAGIVSGIASVVYTYIKHSRCKGHMCGKQADFEIDLSPVPDKDSLFVKVDGSGNQTKETDNKGCPHCSDKKEQVQDA